MKYKIAIVGSGPGGLSAAARAKELDVPHVLLEASPAHANTIQRYQKGKHVMAEPTAVPLRSDVGFEAGSRESVLGTWANDLDRLGVNVRYDSEVAAVHEHPDGFSLDLKDGAAVEAESVILAIGLQGNPRALGVDGEASGLVQYTLDDPEEFEGETIVIVGAGDAAIENALGLAGHNSVIIVNRRDEFARAKDGNLNAITRAIDEQRIQCYYHTTVERIEKSAGEKGAVILNTENGEVRVECDRIIARLGAIPPRRFVEACGIDFPSADTTSLPELSPRYESNVSGLYVIGALGGYPLIKQAMNQGYEVVEYILGRELQPADHGVLEAKFRELPFGLGVDETLSLIQDRVPVFAGVNGLVFRELMIASDVLTPEPGSTIFERNDYTNSFLTVLQGSVSVEAGGEHTVTLSGGEFFGEMSLLSGRRRSATVRAGSDCVLVESPRREIIKLMSSYENVRRTLDEQFIVRALQSRLVPEASVESLAEVAAAAEFQRFRPGEALFSEGEEATHLDLIRSGSVAVSKKIGGRDIVTSYLAAGNYVGEMGLLGNTRRTATVKATVATESIRLSAATFLAMLDRNPGLRERVQEKVRERLNENMRMEAQPEAGDIISFLMQQGLGEATDVLLIDESLCIGCDNCETACAETHDGTSRLDRAAGPSYAKIHVPTSCRHCEDPHCMKDCPPDAIRRAPNGEVFIRDNCIGCGNCESNCPYGVIKMAGPRDQKPSLARWLVFGSGPAPGERLPESGNGSAKQAVKCDMCKDLSGGPACVRACPTGAAIRTSPEQFVKFARRGNA